jgi:hypothetical protein
MTAARSTCGQRRATGPRSTSAVRLDARSAARDKIVAAGSTSVNGTSDFALARYLG